jgi:hypothetical protein
MRRARLRHRGRHGVVTEPIVVVIRSHDSRDVRIIFRRFHARASVNGRARGRHRRERPPRARRLRPRAFTRSMRARASSRTSRFDECLKFKSRRRVNTRRRDRDRGALRARDGDEVVGDDDAR